MLRPEAHHVGVLLLIHHPRVVQLDIQVLVDGVEGAFDGQIILKLHCHLRNPQPGDVMDGLAGYTQVGK